MKRLLLPLFAVCTFLLSAPYFAAQAATMSFDPVSYSSPLESTFNVKLTIDTEGESVTSADAVILYDGSILQVVNIVEGDLGQNPFFPDFFKNVSPAEIYIGASVIDPIDTRTGTGILATITFKGIQAGITNVRFDCTAGRTSDTNISKNDKNATDIVNCASLTPGTYTIGAGNPPTSTPVVGGPIVPTSTPVPIPTTGSFETTTAIFGTGIILLLVAVSGKVLFKI